VLGRVDSKGFASDKAWRDATLRRPFPDPLRRIWRAVHQTDSRIQAVIVSLGDRHHAGGGRSVFGIGGGLSAERSLGFLMSTAFESPGFIRAENVLTYVRAYLEPLSSGSPREPLSRADVSPVR
jgi:hypothetical protein